MQLSIPILISISPVDFEKKILKTVIGTSKMLFLPISRKSKVERMDFASDIYKAIIGATFRTIVMILASK